MPILMSLHTAGSMQVDTKDVNTKLTTCFVAFNGFRRRAIVLSSATRTSGPRMRYQASTPWTFGVRIGGGSGAFKE